MSIGSATVTVNLAKNDSEGIETGGVITR
jgi:hypothetical protein